MPGFRPATALGQAIQDDEDEARAMVRSALVMSHGNIRIAAKHLCVSAPFFQWTIRRLKMNGEPERWRAFFRRRYGLAP